MKFLLDMNVSPRLCASLEQDGWDAVHWSAVGECTASDAAILSYAISRGYVVDGKRARVRLLPLA